MISTQCLYCKHFFLGWTCAAFPDGIPEEIRAGEFDHTKKHPDQKNDILYEEAKD